MSDKTMDRMKVNGVTYLLRDSKAREDMADINTALTEDIGDVSNAVRKAFRGVNLFEKRFVTTGKYLDENGEYVSSTTCYVSDYILVDGRSKIHIANCLGSNVAYCWFYDESLTEVSSFKSKGTGSSTTGEIVKRIPENAKYIRVSGGVSLIDDQIVMTVPTDGGVLKELNKQSIYYPEAVKTGVALNMSGQEETNANTVVSAYIRIKPGMRYTILKNGNSVTTGHAFYAADESYLSSITFRGDETGNGKKTFVAPENAAYIRIMARTQDVDSQELYEDTFGVYKTLAEKGVFLPEMQYIGIALDMEGTETANVNVAVSDYIAIKPETRYVITKNGNSSTTGHAFYDENKDYISSASFKGDLTGTGTKTFTTPEDAKYIRILTLVTDIATQEFYEDTGDRPLKLVVMGDSIVYGYTPNSGVRLTYPWPEHVATVLGCKAVLNAGLSGGVVTTKASDASWATNRKPMCVRYADLPDDGDIYVIEGGVNDYAFGQQLGTFLSTDTETFYGALNVMLAGMVAKVPTKNIVMMTMFPSSAVADPRGDGNTMAMWNEAIVKTAHYYSIPVFDTCNECGFTPHIEEQNTLYISDGTHLTQAGADRFANVMIKYLRSKYVDLD